MAFPRRNDGGNNVQWSVVACKSNFGVARSAVNDSGSVHLGVLGSALRGVNKDLFMQFDWCSAIRIIGLLKGFYSNASSYSIGDRRNTRKKIIGI